MRGAFFDSLLALAERDDRIHLLVGDLGFAVTDAFRKRFPDRFLNVGVAEQNMTGIAAGMALSGKIVFTYSIANFPILRCLEQVRNDVCYHKANVKIVAVGGGLAYGSLGPTHHAVEDLAILRALPEMVVVAPGDPAEAKGATEAIARHQGPCYLRLGRAGEPAVHRKPIDFQLGKAICLTDGDDLTLISTGGLLETAVQTAEVLRSKGLNARVLNMHTVKPLDRDAVLAAARETRAIFTIEEHSIVGGLGSAVAEVLAESAGDSSLHDERLSAPRHAQNQRVSGTPRRPAIASGSLDADTDNGSFSVKMTHYPIFKRFGLPSAFCHTVGAQEYLRAQYGLTPDALARNVSSVLENSRALRAAGE